MKFLRAGAVTDMDQNVPPLGIDKARELSVNGFLVVEWALMTDRDCGGV
jgi:hypothetical protein